MSASEGIREEIGAALATLNIAAMQFRELGEADARQVREAIEATFMNARNRTWWWEHFRIPSSATRFDDGMAFTRICAVVQNPDEQVWFVAEDSQLPEYPVFESTPRLIQSVIGECYGFEYYLVSKNFSWLLCETHHDDFIALGDALRKRLEAAANREGEK